jgi:serine/threonine protein kinase
MDEFYLANGLTIGRTVANTVVLADDAAVDRTHAQVEWSGKGLAKLRCVGADNKLSVGDTAVQEIGLTAGVTFRIGATAFECLPGQRQPVAGQSARGATCPLCGSRSVPAVSSGPMPCPSCGQSVFALNLGAAYPNPFVVPTKFGEHRAERFVARGGMGLVLQGVVETSQQAVAIKLLLAGDVYRQAAERFQQEITLMQRVSHPNVVRLLGYGHTGQFSFLVMEWINGRSFRDTIVELKQQQRLPRFENVLPWFEQACKGLAAVHAVGVIHRDIKPSNILIANDGHVLLADLGVAKRADQSQTALTTTGQVPGTYEYMAPEQLSAPDAVDQRTDLYALGVTFYELLTGDRPVGAWLRASQINSTVPPVFDDILARMLARRPENRYADIYELLAAFTAFRQAVATGGPEAATRPLAPTSKVGGFNDARNVQSRESPPSLPRAKSPSRSLKSWLGVVAIRPEAAAATGGSHSVCRHWGRVVGIAVAHLTTALRTCGNHCLRGGWGKRAGIAIACWVVLLLALAQLKDAKAPSTGGPPRTSRGSPPAQGVENAETPSTVAPPSTSWSSPPAQGAGNAETPSTVTPPTTSRDSPLAQGAENAKAPSSSPAEGRSQTAPVNPSPAAHTTPAVNPDHGQTVAKTDVSQKILGIWSSAGTVNGHIIGIGVTLFADETCLTARGTVGAGGNFTYKWVSGRYSIKDQWIYFRPSVGQPVARRFAFNDGRLRIEYPELGGWFAFKRMP